MKKITFLLTLWLYISGLQAQNVSFEAAEGYDYGEISNQNGWVADAEFSSLFTISSDFSALGSRALKLDIDVSGKLNTRNMAGPEWDIAPLLPADAEVFEINFEVWLPGDDDGQLAFLTFGEGNYGGLVSQVSFSDGKMNVFGPTGQSLDIVSQNSLTLNDFVRIKLKYDLKKEEIGYYIDEKHVFTGNLWGERNLGTLGFYTSGDNVYYIDDIKVTVNRSNSDDKSSSLKHYTRNNRLVLRSEYPIKEVSVFNLLGMQVISTTLNTSSGELDLSSLNAGVYLAKVLVNNEVKTFKFIKN